jgi:hypothetical protein
MHFDAVFLQFFMGEAADLGGLRAIAGQKTVHRFRRVVSVTARIENQYATPASPEHQGGAQSCRAAANDDHVIRAVHIG